MLTEKAAAGLQKLFGKDQIVTDPAELLVYEIDAAQDRGLPDGVVFPHSSADLQRLTGWAQEYGVPLIARGAGTGLSGGAVAEHGGLIVEFSRMNHILEIETIGRSARAEPGVVNLTLDETAKSLGLYYPPDPASGRSATLGGNVAENAGGPHCFKYGVTTNYLTGLECVLADGRIIHPGGGAFDYPEYDFVRLLTGSEGTLGLVASLSVRLLRNPPGVRTMMAAFNSVEQAGAAVSAVIAAGLVPATLEMMDQKIARIIEAFTHAGLQTEAGALLIIEVDGYPAGLDPQMEEAAHILSDNGGFDLRIATSNEERDKIWYGRKSAAGAMARLAPAYLLMDGTVPRSRLAEILETSNHICETHDVQVGYVFHAGDGNLHPFILMYPDDPDQVKRAHQSAEAFLHEVVRLGGSLTGEHGIGIDKRPFMPWMFNPVEMDAMRQVKQMFDPQNLLNPGKVFPAEDRATFTSAGEPITAGAAIGQPPTAPFAPASVADAAQILQSLTQTRQPVVITGSHAARPQAQPVSLDTTCLNKVLEFAPQDLYVTAEAGISVDALQAYLKPHGKWIPLAAPWPEVTLGGLMAANLNSPLRMLYGSLSDQVLAMQVVLADGRILRLGRPVVKNVAGYDLVHLMVGSYGTLGLITGLTCKVTALPRCRRSLLIPATGLEQGLELGRRCLPIALAASAVLLSRGLDLPGAAANSSLAETPYFLTYTAEGTPQDVESELELVRQALQDAHAPEPIELDGFSGVQIWQDFYGGTAQAAIKIRAGLPPKDLPAFVRLQGGHALDRGACLLDFASGMAYAATRLLDVADVRSWLDELRQAAHRLGGYCLVLDMPPAWEGQLTLSGYRPDTLDLMHSLKSQWDPAGILNPGSFLLGQG